MAGRWPTRDAAKAARGWTFQRHPYVAVSTGRQDARTNPTPAEKNLTNQPKKVERSKLSFFTRGLRYIARLILHILPLPPLWGA